MPETVSCWILRRWTHRAGDTYLVTGRYAAHNSHKRFRMVCRNWYHANGINLWMGFVWHVPADPAAAGYKRRLVKRVVN